MRPRNGRRFLCRTVALSLPLLSGCPAGPNVPASKPTAPAPSAPAHTQQTEAPLTAEQVLAVGTRGPGLAQLKATALSPSAAASTRYLALRRIEEEAPAREALAVALAIVDGAELPAQDRWLVENGIAVAGRLDLDDARTAITRLKSSPTLYKRDAAFAVARLGGAQ